MPSSEYANAIGGGLKLKGAKDAGVKKHKKHKKKDVKPTDNDETDKQTERDEDKTTLVGEDSSLRKALAGTEEGEKTDLDAQRKDEVGQFGKTEAQRRHEERRRKRLDERLKREGVKTHKERVEELNKYLSGLSEHHDMPRIGPG